MDRDHTILIDLGDIRSSPEVDMTSAALLTPRRIRFTAMLAGVALLVAAGGSAPPAPPALTQVLTIPTGPYQRYLLEGDRLYSAVPDLGGPTLSVTGYELTHGRPIWKSSVPAPELIGEVAVQSSTGLQQSAGLLLVTVGWRSDNQPRTIALDATTGEPRWSWPNHIRVLSDGRTGLTIEEVFPAGTELTDRRAPNETAVVVTASGRVYSASSLGVVARVVDLATGTLLWSSALSEGVEPVPSPGGPDAELVIETRDGQIEVVTARTGTVRTTHPAAEDTRCDQPECPVRTRWFMIDAETGDAVETFSERMNVFAYGSHLIEFSDSGQPLRTVDPRTDETRIDLTGWQELAWSQSATLLFTRIGAERGSTWLGILEPGGSSVRTLGVVPYRTQHCQVMTGALGCQTNDGELLVWRYQR